MRPEVQIGFVILAIVVILSVAKDIHDIIKSRHQDEEIDDNNTD